ncbi:N-acetylmuramoyl-L-alanine amidase [Owenweeksia hongkongensis DSM 17368]|uniref:N-acetylmuramoyl-L-alanine amidase n=2 Tax=Owenweeksia TaxID=267986 RepID=G8R7C1_OWEHD|nr:N-acetylmuramoyl-L-alanine amidase [Owenweeksia hongkongensis DSM 17368]
MLTGITAYAQPSQKEGVHTVVIDAGHGGHDPGNLGTRRYKTTEKDIALLVALKVGGYIQENFKDVTVIYTRSTDVFVDLQERAKIANRAEADLFISIHCDAFTKSSVSGATSLVMGQNHDDDNLRVAMRENSVIYLEENYEEKYEGFDPNNPSSYIAFSVYQGAFMLQSVTFAQKVQDQFRTRVGRKDRGVKQQPLMVTKMAVMPSVLIELGFLTNPTEEDFLNSEKGQSYMASAIYRAFKEYKEEREQFHLEIAPATPPVQTKPTPTPVQPKIGTENKSVEKTPSSEPTIKQVDTKEVYYCVQLATSGIKKELIPQNFKGVEGVRFYEDGGLYKYIVGQTTNLKTAEALKMKMKDAGFKDAFVVALADGNRISISEASKLLE